MGRCVQICKKIMKFFFSHIGLTILLCVYALLGAVILRAIEIPKEKIRLRSRWARAMEIEYKKQQIKDYIFRMYKKSNQEVYQCNYFYEDAEGSMWATGTNETVIRSDIALKTYIIDSKVQGGPSCFPIAKDNCVPFTCHHVCKPYGDERTLELRDYNLGECKERQNVLIKSLIKAKLNEWQMIIATAVTDHGYTGSLPTDADYKWSYFSALVFCVTSFTLIGYGHVFPSTDFARLFITLYSLFGIVLFLMFTANIGRLFAGGVRYLWVRCCCRICFTKREEVSNEYYKDKQGNLHLSPIELGGEAEITEEERLAQEIARLENILESNNEEILDELDDKVPVPLSLIFLIVTMYLIGGSLIFMEWEGWTLISSIYFTFITLVTIGFGDLVPGLQKATTLEGRIKLTVTVVYIILGLAVLGMALDMLVYAYRKNFKTLGKTVGLLKTKEGEEDLVDEKSGYRRVKI